MKNVYRFQFKEGVPMQDVQNSLLLAALSAENLHGRARIQLDAGFRLRKKQRLCLIDSETQVGQDIVRLFTGYLQHELGEDAYEVERVSVSDEELKPSGEEEIE